MIIYMKSILGIMKEVAKKMMVVCGIIVSICAAMIFTSSKPVFADYTFSGRDLNDKYCKQSDFFGLVAWDCGVTISDDTNLGKGIWMIASNVATDIAVVATYLIIGYVIYGGYLYTFSGGDPGKVANGKKTLTQAFIGLAITMSASVIMGAIRIALVGGAGDMSTCVSSGGCVGPDQMITNLFGWVTGIAGIVSAIFLVYGAIQYITSTGDSGKLKKAKETILYSLIGLAIVALATVIIAFVSNTIRNAEQNALIDNKVTIAKEVYEK